MTGMVEPLPPELLEADRALDALLGTVRFSRHLNPVNAQEARRAFEQGREAPPFAYEPLPDAPGLLAALDALPVPRAHPLGALVAAVVEEARALVRALHERTAEAFDALAQVAGWYPMGPVAIPTPEADPPPAEPGGPVSAAAMAETFAVALTARGFTGWSVLSDPVMSARVLVDARRREVRIDPAARFRARDLRALVAHEVDVHVARAEAGARQPLRLFATGLSGAGATEEGLALHAEALTGGLGPRQLRRQALVAQAVLDARELGFRELYERLRHRAGPEVAWNACQRLKRGLARPELPGVYAKDAIYHLGWLAVARFREAGGLLGRLYVGKVAVDHPVDEWVRAGWVVPGELPRLWAEAPASSPGRHARRLPEP